MNISAKLAASGTQPNSMYGRYRPKRERVRFAMMPINGSIASITVVCIVGALAFSGLGLLAASRAASLEAISGILNLAMLPMWVLSGVFFSTANFPEVLQPFIHTLPLTALNDALRAVILEGAPMTTIGQELAVLGVWGGGAFIAALRLFRWQ